jgi:hypothetical protein
MPTHSRPLEDAFVEDHRHLTEGFSRLLQLLEQDNIPAAIETAEEVDRLAGGHIEFEEHVLYPKVKETYGSEYVANLYDEHGIALQAIRALLAHKEDPQLSPGEREKLIQQVRTGLDHTISCGTLLSHLTVLDEAEQRELLSELLRFRQENKRWTELEEGNPPTTEAE